MQTHLVVETVDNIPRLEGKDQPERVGDMAETTPANSLFAKHSNVDKDPKNKAGTEFIEGLDIERSDRRIKLPSDEELEREGHRKKKVDKEEEHTS